GIDVYALGVMLFEILTMRLPFSGDAVQLQQAHAGMRPKRPSEWVDVLPSLDAIVLRCLAKSPDRRYARVSELRSELLGALEQAPGAERQWRVSKATSQATPAVATAPVHQRVAMLFLSEANLSRAVPILDASGGALAYFAKDRGVGVLNHRAAESP